MKWRENNDLHSQWLEGTQVILVSPADHLARFVEDKGSRQATPENHGVPWWAAHGVP